MKNIRVASVQFEHLPGNKKANIKKIQAFVEQAAEKGVEMIVFPECCITGYWHLRHLSYEELMALAEPVCAGESSQVIISMAEKYKMTIGAGLIEKDDGELYNTYIIAMPDGVCRRHRKIHAFISEFVSSGSEYTVFDTPHGCRVGVLICYDNNIVENARITALRGAELIMAPHQTGGCSTKNPHIMGKIDRTLWDRREDNPDAIEKEFRGQKGREWLMRWLPARAHDNGVFLIYSNGVGVDDNEIRTGNAMILDPYGRIIVETWKAGDDMVIADLDVSLLEKCTGRRWNRTRRPELYKELAVPTGIEEDTRKVRFDKNGI